MYVISNRHSCYFCGTLRWWSGRIDRNGRVGDGREVGDEFGNHLRLPLGQQPQFLGLLLLFLNSNPQVSDLAYLTNLIVPWLIPTPSCF